MHSFVRVAILVILFCLVGAVWLSAQGESPSFAGETTVNVVEVPVQVIDAETGEPVLGLTAPDFEVFEDDVRQPVSNFAELWRSEVDAVDVGGFDADPAAEGASELRTRSVEMIYLLDLFLMNKEGRNRAIDGLRATYESGVPEGQNVTLVAFDGALETFADRSDDRDEILDALDELGYVTARGNEQTIALSGQLVDEEVSGERDQAFYERRQRNREFINDLEKAARRVGDAAAATMSRYSAADGRKVLVVFTPGHPRATWVPEYAAVDYVNAAAEYPVHDLWRGLAHEAADLGFTLYAVDSSGVRANFGSDVEVGITDSLAEAFDKGSVFRPKDAPGVETPTGSDPNFAFDPGGETQNLGSWLERTRKSMMILATTATGGDALFAEDAAGNQSSLSSHEQVITVEDGRYREAVAKGYFSYHTAVEIEGGEQKVFIGIQEELSGRTSIMPIEFDH